MDFYGSRQSSAPSLLGQLNIPDNQVSHIYLHTMNSNCNDNQCMALLFRVKKKESRQQWVINAFANTKEPYGINKNLIQKSLVL